MSYQVLSNQENSTNSDIGLGIGLNFNNPGIFNTNYLTIEQFIADLKNLLLTTKGERIHNVDFGTNLLYIIFEPNVSELKQEIQTIIIDDVEDQLPGINIENINVITAEDDPTITHNIIITITFSVLDIDNTQTLSIAADENGGVQII